MEELNLWFLANRRSFPWREERTPYKVWVSEVMLQQTRASVVISYFLRWMERFPTVEALASASLEEVIKMWEGLGYYSRARNLHQGAKEIVERFRGKIPGSKEALASIRGLGPYTTGAILSFGFAQRAVAVDGNVTRVISRYLAIEEDVGKAKVRRWIAEKTEELLDLQKPWITSEALIELGALICRPKPLCSDCPLQGRCLGAQKGIAEVLPMKNNNSQVIPLTRTVAVVKSEGQFLVRKGALGEVMEDLYQFPYFEERVSPKQMEKLLFKQFGLRCQWRGSLKEVTHTFTKYKARLFPSLISAISPSPILGWVWVAGERLLQLPFSAGHLAIARQLELG